MARPIRIEFEGALYHVTGRGNERKTIFRTVRDYEKFTDYVRQAMEKYAFLLHAYVFMPNHYHLIIETPKANLSQIMHFLNGSYTTYFNTKRKRAGHLLQGRYKAFIVEGNRYLLELSRYLHLNPVRAKLVEMPADYPWSSYRAYVFACQEEMVFRDLIWTLASPVPRKALQTYKDFVESARGEKIENPIKKVLGGTILGTGQFKEEITRRIDQEDLLSRETSHRRALRPSPDFEYVLRQVSEYFQVDREALTNGRGDRRNLAIYLAKKHTGLTHRQIGERFKGISYSAVTRVCQRFERKAATERRLSKWVNDLGPAMSNVKG